MNSARWFVVLAGLVAAVAVVLMCVVDGEPQADASAVTGSEFGAYSGTNSACAPWDAAAYSCGDAGGTGCILDDEFGGSACATNGLDTTQWQPNNSWVATGTATNQFTSCANQDAINVTGGIAQLRVINNARTYCPSDWDAGLVDAASNITGPTSYDVSMIQTRVSYQGDVWIEFRIQLAEAPSWPTEGSFSLDCQKPSFMGAFNNGGSYFDMLFHDAGPCLWAIPAGATTPFGVSKGSGESDFVDLSPTDAGVPLVSYYSCYDGGPPADGGPNNWICPQTFAEVTQSQFPWYTPPRENFHVYTEHLISGVSETNYIDGNLVYCAVAPGQPDPLGCPVVHNLFGYPQYWVALAELGNGTTGLVPSPLMSQLDWVHIWCTDGTKDCLAGYL